VLEGHPINCGDIEVREIDSKPKGSRQVAKAQRSSEGDHRDESPLPRVSSRLSSKARDFRLRSARIGIPTHPETARTI